MSGDPPAGRTRPDPDTVGWRDAGDGVHVLTLQRPTRMNALDPAAAAALRQALGAALGDRSVRVLVLHGAGGHFCTGFDLRHQRVPGEEGALAILQDCCTLLQDAAAPSIAAVDGNAYGAGWSLALACDQIVAGADARFCAPFTGIGLAPDVGMAATLQQRVGPGRARRWMFEGTVIDAALAQAAGLVDEPAPAGGALEAALAMARRWSLRAPLALAATRALARTDAPSMAALFAIEREHQARLAASADFAEGVAAFRERRPPRFEGRPE